MKNVWVELNTEEQAVRIFKHWRDVREDDVTAWVNRAKAVRDIRRQIWLRDGRKCQHCGNDVTWNTMQLHERIWKSRGGEVSVENGACLCAECHLNGEVAGHGKRKVRFSGSSV